MNLDRFMRRRDFIKVCQAVIDHSLERVECRHDYMVCNHCGEFEYISYTNENGSLNGDWKPIEHKDDCPVTLAKIIIHQFETDIFWGLNDTSND